MSNFVGFLSYANLNFFFFFLYCLENIITIDKKWPRRLNTQQTFHTIYNQTAFTFLYLYIYLSN